MKTPLWLLALIFVASCGSTGPQVVIDSQSSELRVRSSARSVMIHDISLPAYAEAVEISLRDEDGTLVEQKGQVWADAPARAMSGVIVRNLSTITGAQVAADPWPLEGYPQVEVTIRVEQMFARDDGSISLTGYYALRREYGRSAIRQFAIERAGSPEAKANLARAYDLAWRDLAEQIAKDL
ncbi:MAG TPA: hypothetical protein DEO85_14380 [Maritimibacter sp.]|nr:hypothetical protein [Maritimibacter sp.]